MLFSFRLHSQSKRVICEIKNLKGSTVKRSPPPEVYAAFVGLSDLKTRPYPIGSGYQAKVYYDIVSMISMYPLFIAIMIVILRIIHSQ